MRSSEKAHPSNQKRKDAPVAENKVISLDKRAEDEERPFFEQLLQAGARKLLQAAIENEVIDYIQFHKDRRDEHGQRLVVRNGHLPVSVFLNDEKDESCAGFYSLTLRK
jgi:hypothetical protein